MYIHIHGNSVWELKPQILLAGDSDVIEGDELPAIKQTFQQLNKC